MAKVGLRYIWEKSEVQVYLARVGLGYKGWKCLIKVIQWYEFNYLLFDFTWCQFYFAYIECI